jgi:hypothetical protein
MIGTKTQWVNVFDSHERSGCGHAAFDSDCVRISLDQCASGTRARKLHALRGAVHLCVFFPTFPQHSPEGWGLSLSLASLSRPSRFRGVDAARPRGAASERSLGSVSFRAYWSHDTLSSPVKRPPGCRVRSPFGACDESVASSQARVGACGIGRAGNFGVRRAPGNSALLTWCS